MPPPPAPPQASTHNPTLSAGSRRQRKKIITRRPRLLESEELPANLPAGVQLGVHVDVRRVGPHLGQHGIGNRDCVLDQEPAEVQVGGGSGWDVQVLNDSAAGARRPVMNVRQERAVDVRKLNPVRNQVALNGNGREPLRARRSRSRFVRAVQERDEAFRLRRYRGQAYVILAAPDAHEHCQRPCSEHQTAAHSKPPDGLGVPHAQGGLGIPVPRGLFKQSFVIEMSGRRQAYRCRARAAPVPVEAPVAVYDLRASVAARERSAASISASEIGAGTVHDPRCIVGTRIAATSPPGPRSTTAVAASSGPWLALITSVQVPSEGHVRFRACTPSRDVSANSSLRERRSPPTIPSAVPETIYPIAVP